MTDLSQYRGLTLATPAKTETVTPSDFFRAVPKEKPEPDVDAVTKRLRWKCNTIITVNINSTPQLSHGDIQALFVSIDDAIDGKVIVAGCDCNLTS